jgi:uncharacterized protein
MYFEFDPVKAKSNLIKHKVSFEEAQTSLLDPMALVREDGDALGEQRYVLVGMSGAGRMLAVVYTLRGEDESIFRLISARKATSREEKYYAQEL